MERFDRIARYAISNGSFDHDPKDSPASNWVRAVLRDDEAALDEIELAFPAISSFREITPDLRAWWLRDQTRS
ncbi:hypothetical protein V0U79_07620 [Hyphobacterium sp. HN65]|uniref:Uncharacterized protein n=1 Tax=Hyphobacterium lacteum TaxID=3116575 RepID=A0ABU7LRH0_9PROT|nr:hypothetical protein [Hyphobacterium sp. HN65]MEE2526231.1 hypothetical protein [Hyphobacterium sp. HN65]